MEEEIDFTKLKYVLYARKSTDDSEKQTRSIPDQIKECKDYAARYGLNIIGEPIIEKRSAKIPNQRPEFRKMLTAIRSGLYDGILAWNPDRLARNMLEGGEIINMVDEGQIVDLKFVTHHFSKDPNGKMLLGIAFVLSKQYSDKLSVDVRRGLDNKFKEGRSHVPKHGYILDEEGIYHQDEGNYDLMVQAWKMRVSGDSYEAIIDFLREEGYTKRTKNGRVINITKQMLTDIFKDPFYYGVLYSPRNDERVDLIAAYNFVPATDLETYNRVQALSYRKIKAAKPHKTTFYPLRAMIKCSFCNGNMYIGPSTGYKRYLFARCDNSGCPRKKKSIRMKIIFDFIYDFLKKGLNFTEADYHKYYKDLSQVIVKNVGKLKIKLHSLQGALSQTKHELNTRSLGILALAPDSTARKINENKIEELSAKKVQLEKEIAKLEEKLKKPEDERLTLEQFLNLSKKASPIVQAANAIIKDAICRQIFLNLTVDEKKVLSYQAKEPFATLLKRRELLSSADERT